MAKLSKRLRAIREKVDSTKQYGFEEAAALLAELSNVKFVESVDVAVNLGVDPRKSDQVVRGATLLPHGTGKTVRVAVFTQGANAEAAIAAGADKVGMNSAAVANPELINQGAEQFGSQCIVVAIDARKNDNGDGWEVYTHGGRRATGMDAVAWAREAEQRGAGELLVTSMDRDGTRDGYDIPLLQVLSDLVGVPIIASGGAGNLEHLREALQEGRADAVLAASIFHFREYTIEQAHAFLAEAGLPVRSRRTEPSLRTP